MSYRKKQDAEQIRQCLNELESASWLGESRRWWPKFVYHYTDIKNAVNILENNELLSRAICEQNNLMQTDNASPEVISQTDSRWKNYVRLYFRPRTPTQYRNEGFRPENQRLLGGAHCPVPVYFLFDAKKTLCMNETMFSEGSLAADTEPFGDALSFSNIPFQSVYHDGWFDQLQGHVIKFHRHAEVIVPQRLSLDYLKYIWCRSSAEYQMLLHLLPARLRRKWVRKIGLGSKLNLFFRKWTYVEEISLSEEFVTFRFNSSSESSGPFKAHVLIQEDLTRKTYVWKNDEYYAEKKLAINLEAWVMPEFQYSIYGRSETICFAPFSLERFL